MFVMAGGPMLLGKLQLTNWKLLRGREAIEFDITRFTIGCDYSQC